MYYMSTSSNPQAGPLDELVERLLQFGGLTSLMISDMAAFARSGRSAPDAKPIPDVMHDLILGVIGDLPKRYGQDQIRTAAEIVERVTDSMSSDIYVVSPELFDELEEDDDSRLRALKRSTR